MIGVMYQEYMIPVANTKDRKAYYCKSKLY